MKATVGQLAQLLGGQLVGPAESANLPLGRSVVDLNSAAAHADNAAGKAIVLWNLTPGPQDTAPEFTNAHSGVVTTQECAAPQAGWTIVVEDASNALRAYASWRRKRFAGEIVAVTGPIGKSTTRRMIEHLASEKFPADAVAGHRSDVSPYDALLVLTDLTDQAVAVVECGGTEDLATCDPTVAVLTSHPTAAGFGREMIASQAVLGTLSARTKVVLPGNIRLDDDVRVAVSHITTYGREADCDIPLRHVRCGGGQLSFHVGETEFQVPVWGRHHAPAAAAAIAVARLWNLSFLEIVTKLAKFSSHAEGCSVFHHANMTFINDTRHGGRDSLRAALEMLREVSATTTDGSEAATPGRKVVVCESLADGSNSSPEVSRRFGEQVVSIGGADLLLAIGQHADVVVQAACESGMPAAATRVHIRNNTQRNKDKSTHRPESDSWVQAIAAELTEILRPGDTVLFKSGPAGQLQRVIAAIKQENNFVPWVSPELGSVLPSASAV